MPRRHLESIASSSSVPVTMDLPLKVQKPQVYSDPLHFAAAGRKLFEDGTFSDMTVTCAEDVYRCHRAVVCPQSSFFAGSMMGGFKESEDRAVNLLEDDPDAVQRMMRFLYTGDYCQDFYRENGKVQGCFPDDTECHEHYPTRTGQRFHGWTPEGTMSIDLLGLDKTEYGLQDLGVDYRNRLQAERRVDDIRKAAAPEGRLLHNLGAYQIADKYGVDGMKRLARGRISFCLNQFTTDAEKISALDRYILHLSERDPVRIEFISYLVKWTSESDERGLLIDDPHLQELLRDHNDLALMLIQLSYRRMQRLEEKMRCMRGIVLESTNHDLVRRTCQRCNSVCNVLHNLDDCDICDDLIFVCKNCKDELSTQHRLF